MPAPKSPDSEVAPEPETAPAAPKPRYFITDDSKAMVGTQLVLFKAGQEVDHLVGDFLHRTGFPFVRFE